MSFINWKKQRFNLSDSLLTSGSYLRVLESLGFASLDQSQALARTDSLAQPLQHSNSSSTSTTTTVRSVRVSFCLVYQTDTCLDLTSAIPRYQPYSPASPPGSELTFHQAPPFDIITAPHPGIPSRILQGSNKVPRGVCCAGSRLQQLPDCFPHRSSTTGTIGSALSFLLPYRLQ